MPDEYGIDKHSESRLNNWLTKEAYDREKTDFIVKNKGQFSTAFENNRLFPDLPPDLKNKGKELMACFLFGVCMAYQRFGFKYPIYDFTFNIAEQTNSPAFGFSRDKNSFLIKTSFVKGVLESIRDKGVWSTIKRSAGIDAPVPAEDFFEIAGVEEAAHLMFYNEKKHLGNPIVTDANPKYAYYTSDMESRALKWKTAYVKRYMPQYYDSIQRTTREIQKVRLVSRRSPVT